MVYTLHFFPLQNAVCFIILTYLVPVLFTFYVQGVLKLKKNSGAKRLISDFCISLIQINRLLARTSDMFRHSIYGHTQAMRCTWSPMWHICGTESSFVVDSWAINDLRTPFNPLTPNDSYRGRTAPLTCKVSFYIYLFNKYTYWKF
jgi:hypothetical protein